LLIKNQFLIAAEVDGDDNPVGGIAGFSAPVLAVARSSFAASILCFGDERSSFRILPRTVGASANSFAADSRAASPLRMRRSCGD